MDIREEKAFQAWLTTVDRCCLAWRAAARAVTQAKAQAWEGFGEATERDFWLASKRFWQTLSGLWKGKQGSA